MANFIGNELLCFLSCQYDKVEKDTLFSVLCDFYSLDESIAAKQLLINECDKLGLADAIKEYVKRRQNAKGDGIKKVIKDVIDIWCIIDTQKAGQTASIFVAVDPHRLPSLDVNSLNVRHLFSLFSNLQKQVTDIVIELRQIFSVSHFPEGSANPCIGRYVDIKKKV